MSWGMVAVAGASLVGGVLSGQGARSAAKDSNAAQERITAATNASNERMFHESRGSTGHAVLPEYFGGTEKALSNDILAAYRGAKGTTGLGEQTAADLTDAFNSGNTLIGDIFSDKTYADRQGFQGGINKARTAATNQAMGDAIARIKAARMRNGMSGGSSFTNNQMMGASLAGRIGNAEAEAMAAKELYDQNLALKLGLLDTPASRVQQAYQLQAADDYGDIDSALDRLKFFYIGTGNAPQAITPMVQTVPNSNQYLGAAIQTGANSYLNYMQQQQLLDAMAGNKAATPSTASYQDTLLNSDGTFKLPGS